MAEFLPLSVAAAIAYGSLIDGDLVPRDRNVLDEHLDVVAKALATVVSVYRADGESGPVVLPPEQVAGGRFSEGGQRLEFADGGAPVSALRIRNSDLSMAIELLRLRPPLLARR